MKAKYDMFVGLLLLMTCMAVSCETFAAAGNLILSGGYSPQSDNPRTWVEQFHSKSTQYGAAFEGTRFGASVDYNLHGDDDRNTYVTGYVLARPLTYGVVGAGLMYSDKPLRTVGLRRNLYAMAGLENDTLFGTFGGTIRVKHWSNGHIHQFTGWDGIPNPPRNVISIGLVIPFKG